MKVLKVSEVIDATDQLIKKKQNEQKQIVDIKDKLNKVIELGDDLKGEGGEAIKQYFAMLHIPVLLTLDLFLDKYIKQLKDIQKSVRDYESEKGLVRDHFIEHDVQKSLNKIQTITQDSVEKINNDFSKVLDLVNGAAIMTAPLDLKVNQTKQENQDTVDKLGKLDHEAKSGLEDSEDRLKQISQLVGKIKHWSKDGVYLNKDTVHEVKEYFLRNDIIHDMVNDAQKLAAEQGDTTPMGDIASWIHDINTGKGYLDTVSSALAIQIMSTKMLKLERDEKGGFRILTSSKWKKGPNESKLAKAVGNLLKKGGENPSSLISRYVSQFGGEPGGVLKKIAGLDPKAKGTTLGKLMGNTGTHFKFNEEALKNYKVKPDIKATERALKASTRIGKQLTKKIPGIGTVISIADNVGEFYKDDNKNMSLAEKSGRFAAGVALDTATGELTTAGAVVGTMICPGVGTVIGGAVGLIAGVAVTAFASDTVKKWGENVGHAFDKGIDDAKELGKKAYDVRKDVVHDVSDTVSSIGRFVGGLFG